MYCVFWSCNIIPDINLDNSSWRRSAMNSWLIWWRTLMKEGNASGPDLSKMSNNTLARSRIVGFERILLSCEKSMIRSWKRYSTKSSTFRFWSKKACWFLMTSLCIWSIVINYLKVRKRHELQQLMLIYKEREGFLLTVRWKAHINILRYILKGLFPTIIETHHWIPKGTKC